MNWVDLLIVLFIVYFLVMGYFQGFIRGTIELLGLVVSLLLTLKLYPGVSQYIENHFGFPMAISKIVSVVCVWFAIYLIYYIVMLFIYKKIPEKIKESKFNRFGGGAPALVKSMIVVSFLLTLILILPIPGKYKDAIAGSQIGGDMIKHSEQAQNYLQKEFGGVVEETLTFLTVKEESDETTNLGFKTTKVSIDETSEKRMLDMVNDERTSRGLKPLVADEKLREVARAHSKDMFEKGYFSHTSLDGKSPFDRMQDAGITFLVAGENLALAPTLDIAHRGLMNSPGHRANILTAEFGKVGIGVIDGDSYGKMFAQEFAD